MATLDLDQFHRNAIPMSIRYFSYQQADSVVGCSRCTAMNMMVAFYAATFPGIVQDLPEVIQSEKEVMEGTRE
jgi:hypothetical protein